MSRALITSAVLALAKRRGYSAAAGKASEGLKVDSAAAAPTSSSPSAYSGSSSWVPDPVTGYYRPASVDAAATREQHSLLSKQQKSRD